MEHNIENRWNIWAQKIKKNKALKAIDAWKRKEEHG